jgi:hypothetical protein
MFLACSRDYSIKTEKIMKFKITRGSDGPSAKALIFFGMLGLLWSGKIFFLEPQESYHPPAGIWRLLFNLFGFRGSIAILAFCAAFLVYKGVCILRKGEARK